jgi:hypothetical protein
MLRSIDPNLGPIFTDQNFKATFKTYEAILTSGEKRLKDWGCKLFGDIKARHDQNLLRPKAPSANASKTFLAAKTSLVNMIGSRKASLANVSAPPHVSAPVDVSPAKPVIERKEPEIKPGILLALTQQPSVLSSTTGIIKDEEPIIDNTQGAKPITNPGPTATVQKDNPDGASLPSLNNQIDPPSVPLIAQAPIGQDNPSIYKPNLDLLLDGKTSIPPADSSEPKQVEIQPSNSSSNPYAPNLRGGSPPGNAQSEVEQPTIEPNGVSDAPRNEADSTSKPVEANNPSEILNESKQNLAEDSGTKNNGSQNNLLDPSKPPLSNANNGATPTQS